LGSTPPLHEKLEEHLRVLQHEGAIAARNRRNIPAGENWQEVEERQFNPASLILLLISANCFASDYQYGVELQRALKRHRANEARVIPVLTRPCDGTAAPFADLQVILRNHRPLACWPALDAGVADAAREIRAALDGLHNLTSGRRPTQLLCT